MYSGEGSGHRGEGARNLERGASDAANRLKAAFAQLQSTVNIPPRTQPTETERGAPRARPYSYSCLAAMGCATLAFQLLLAHIAGLGGSASGGGAEAKRPPSRIPPPSRLPVRLRLVQSEAVSRTRDTSTCVSLDWWPAEKCDYGSCPWTNSSLLTADLSDPLLGSAIAALAPLHLRVGGSLADQVSFALSREDGCPPFAVDVTRRIGFTGGCLRLSRWLEVLSFCERLGCGVLFSVNALRGRTRDECQPAALPAVCSRARAVAFHEPLPGPPCRWTRPAGSSRRTRARPAAPPTPARGTARTCSHCCAPPPPPASVPPASRWARHSRDLPR